MIGALSRLLGEDAAIFRRYVCLAVLYGVLSGGTIAVALPLIMALLQANHTMTVRWLGLLLTGAVGCWLLRREVEKAGINVGLAVLGSARQRIGVHVSQLPVGWFTAENTARLGHVITHGMAEIAQLPAHVVTPLISGAVTPVVLVIALFALDPTMGTIAVLTLPLMAIIFLLSARIGRSADAAYQRGAASTSQRAVEFAQSQSVLRAFGGEDGGGRFLEQAIEFQNKSGRRLIWLSTLCVVLDTWVLQAVLSAFLVAAASRLTDSVSIAEGFAMVAGLLIVVRFVDPLLDIAAYGAAVRGARSQLHEVDRLLSERPLAEPKTPQSPQDASIELFDVSFRYAAGEALVLDGVNLRVEPGSMLALIGASGSGKTTLMRLIARFFDVDAGQVKIGGIDIRDMRTVDLSGQISQIFQDSWLFQGSIAENIRIGRPDATDADIRDVSSLAGVAEIVDRLPNGYDTIVGEGGARLSGGERQRVAIARALIRNSPILLVDEATAALDAENQDLIARMLASLRGQRTLVVIAHQLSTVRMADKIVVLDNGRIVETGTPDALDQEDSLYRRFLRQRQAAKGWRIIAKP